MKLKSHLTRGELSNLWVLEFSQSQTAFSVRTLDDSLDDNLEMFHKAMPCDYAILAIGRSQDEMEVICNALKLREDRSSPFSAEEKQELRLELERSLNRLHADQLPEDQTPMPTEPKMRWTNVRFVTSETQSAPPRRMFLLYAGRNIPEHGGDIWIIAYDVLAIRTVTYVDCSIRHPEGQSPKLPLTVAEARDMRWTIDPPSTDVEPIILDDEGLTNSLEFSKQAGGKEQIIIARWPESDDETKVPEAALAFAREYAEEQKIELRETLVDFAFTGHATPSRAFRPINVPTSGADTPPASV